MTYTEKELDAGIKFLNNANVDFAVESNEETSEMQVMIDVCVNERIWTDGTSIWADGVVKGVKAHSISLVATYEDWDDEAYWGGGLSGHIYYDGSGVDGTWFDGGDLESPLINKHKDATSDGLIYTDDGFIKNAIKYMTEHCDFDPVLEKYLDFDYSEQGMQDDEAVNLDVELDGDFWIECYKRSDVKKAA